MEMTKFVDADDPGFLAVSGELRRWIREMAIVETPRHAASDRSRAERQKPHDQQPQPTAQATAQATAGMVYRIRGVPQAWNVDQLQSFLTQQEELQPRGGSASPVISSLADEIHGRSRVATATFRSLPPALQASTLWSKNLPLADQPSPSSQPAHLTFDNKFYGITTLYSPPSEDHQIE